MIDDVINWLEGLAERGFNIGGRRNFLRTTGRTGASLCLAGMLVPTNVVSDNDQSTQQGVQAVSPITLDYTTILRTIGTQRKSYKTQYDSADENGKKEIIAQAREHIFHFLTRLIMPSWYGTSWDFNGTSETPGQGSIACGYFVSTTLRDAGFNIPRRRLAQQPASYMIKNFADPKTNPGHIFEFSNKGIAHVAAFIDQNLGRGLYIAGLDTHVGFIVHNGKDMRFVHSSYYNPPRCVVSEPIIGNNPLAHSKYRMIGTMLTDTMVVNWINNHNYSPLKYDYFRR